MYVNEYIVSLLYLVAAFSVLKLFSRAVSEDMFLGTWTLVFACFGAAGFALAAAYFPRAFLLRGLAAISFLLATSALLIHPTKTNQAMLLLTYALMVIGSVPSRLLGEGVRAAQFTILGTYVISGGFKIYSTVVICITDTLRCSTGNFARIIYDNYVQTGRFGPLTEFLLLHEWMVMWGFFAVCAFQVLIPLLYFRGFGRRYVGFELIAFHVFIYLAMGITFFENIIVLFILFILPLRFRNARSTAYEQQ